MSTAKYCPPYGAFQREKTNSGNACGECHAVRDEKTIRSSRLNEYLASVEEQAEDMFSRLVKEYADRQGVTEQLKAENQLLWIQKMNNIRACVWEVVTENIILMTKK